MKNQKGFSLLELAMVMFIISLVLAGTLAPLSTLLEGKQRTEAEKELDNIREALIGFAMINGYLPCPTTTADPASANYGLEDNTCVNASGNPASDPAAEGYLPWRTLGLHELDPWGTSRNIAGDPWTGYWRYRVDRNFSDSANPITLTTQQFENLTIVDDQGNLLIAATERPVAIVYSTGANQAADDENANFEAGECGIATGYDAGAGTACFTGGFPLYKAGTAEGVGGDATFDDIVMWISRPLLFNRMVTAGRLP